MNRWGLALVMVVAATGCGGEERTAATTPGASSTTDASTVTTTMTTQAHPCPAVAESLREAITQTVRAVGSVEAQSFAIGLARSGFGNGELGDELTLAAAEIRILLGDVEDSEAGPLIDESRALLVDALRRVHPGLDDVADGVRQGNDELIGSGQAELEAGTALLSAARASLPEDCEKCGAVTPLDRLEGRSCP